MMDSLSKDIPVFLDGHISDWSYFSAKMTEECLENTIRLGNK